MSKEKILTISIAAYNAEKDLEKCINSLISSKFIDEIEIIIVNDGSKDNTLAIANNYKKLYPNSIIVIDKENGNHGSTLNASIKISTGKYYKVLDSDDCFNTENFDKLLLFLKKTDVDLISNNRKVINIESKKEVYKSMIKDNCNIDFCKKYSFDEVASYLYLAMANMTIKTDILKKMGYKITEKSSYVDVEFVIYPVKDIKSIVFLDYYIYEYYVGQENQSINIKVMQKRENQHYNIIRNLINYFDNEKLSEPKKKLVKGQILDMIFIQYRLYITMSNKEGKEKIQNFDEWLQNNKYDFYNEIISYGKEISKNETKVILSLRKRNFKNYYTVSKYYNISKKIKGVLKK